MLNFEFDVEKFIVEIEELIATDLDFIESVIEWCSQHDYELETIVPVIKKTPALKSRLQSEALRKNLLRA
jgi:hypothetical protein